MISCDILKSDIFRNVKMLDCGTCLLGSALPCSDKLAVIIKYSKAFLAKILF